MKLLLCSFAGKIIAKAGFLFDKPLHELKVVCITTAANVYVEESKSWLRDEMQAFTDFGLQLEEYDLLGKTTGDVAEMFLNADVVYVTGGNSYYLLEHMQACNFQIALEQFLMRGAVYIGSSAGMVVTCPSIDFIGDLDDPAKASLTDYTGLGLIDFNLMPHIDHPKYADKIQKLVDTAKSSGPPILGLRDDQALVVTDHYMRII